MIEEFFFETSQEFLDFWESLNPLDAIDLQEALTIYFNLETYDLGAV